MRRWNRTLGGLSLSLVSTCRLLAQPPTDPAASHPIPPFTVPAAQQGVAYEHFIILGDMGTGSAGQRTVASAMSQRAKADGLDFILTVGDNFYDEGVKSVDDPLWKTAFEDVYSDALLQVPVYATLGNHDHKGNIQAQIDYSQKSKNWRMPAPHYTFTRTLGDGTKVQFFAVDTDPVKFQKPEAAIQITWLDQELGKSDARWKFVYGHHPLYCHTHRARTEERKTLRDAFEPVFVKHKVDAYFAGHDHILEMLKPIDGVNYVVSGGGGGTDNPYGVDWTDEAFYAATGGGFAICRVSRNELVFEFVRLDGKTQYAHILSK